METNRTALEIRLLTLLFGKEYAYETIETIRMLASKEVTEPIEK